MNFTYQGLKTQTPTLVGKNNKIPHQGMDAKPKHNFMKFKKYTDQKIDIATYKI